MIGEILPSSPHPLVNQPAESTQFKATDAITQPVLAEETIPGLNHPPSSVEAPAAGPATAESFLYRYQLDLSLNFSFSSQTTTTQAEPERAFVPPPMPTFTLPNTISRRGVEPGSRRAVLLGALSEKRAFHARIFRQQSALFAQQFSPSTAEKVRQTSTGIARSYTVNFSLDISFLQQFARQSGTAAEFGESTLNQYTDLSATLNTESAETAKEFFNRVDELLNNARDHIQQELPAFLSNMQGVSATEQEAIQSLLNERIEHFFDKASSFLNQARQTYDSLDLAPQETPALAVESMV